MPPPFQTVAVLGDGGLTAGIDAYGDVVDLRPGPAGPALIDNAYERQRAGTVPAATGIVPLVANGRGAPLPLWRADSLRQRYLAGTNVLRTVGRFGRVSVSIECAASGGELGCVSGPVEVGGSGIGRSVEVSFQRDLLGGGSRVHLDDGRAARIVAAARIADRRRLAAARPLGDGAPAWASRLHERSLLVLRALTDRRSGAVAAGARDGWAHVWPRDAAAVALALAAAGRRGEARRVARFLLALDLAAAARFDGAGEPLGGREAQGDAAGWVAAAARAVALPAPAIPFEWRNRADYQEKSSGEYLGNALAAGAPVAMLVREPADPESGLDSAAAWAVRPFPRPALFPAVRRTLRALAATQRERFGPGATVFGLVPSGDWPEADPWTAPTAWSAWNLAVLGDRRGALSLLAALRRAATPAGLLPERVDARTGVPRSTAPLAWSHAFAVLALRELWPRRPSRGR
jgi:hypothetical protein